MFVYDAFGSLIAEYAIDNPQPNPAPNTSYLTTDTLGSPRIVTGKNGEVLSRRDFLPFGEEIATNQANRKAALGYNYGSGNAMRQAFTGYERDIEIQLDYAINRYHNFNHGRFQSPDPENAGAYLGSPQSWNAYAYAMNNPMKFVDPLGLAAECPPIYPGCFERDGKYYWIDPDGVEAEISDEVITLETIENRNKHSNSTMSLVAIPLPENHPCRKSKTSLDCQLAQLDMIPIVPAAPITKSGGILSKIINGIARFFGGGKAVSKFANGITREIIQQAARDTGPAVRVVTNLTQSPQAGRALSVAVGDAAEKLAGTARNGGKLFSANIPKALIETLETAGLVEKRITMMGGVTGTELYFRAEATEFIIEFFR